MFIERRFNLSVEEFEDQYLQGNKPVIVTDDMCNWDAINYWNPSYFIENFGQEDVQVYDSLFNCIGINTLEEYIRSYFNKAEQSSIDNIPYVRWYTRLKDFKFTWADEFFKKIDTQWHMPYFLPKKNYLLPFCSSSREINPVHDNFPGKGLFVSASGAKTKLHYDPWCSDAILCQVYGQKKIIIYSPDQKKYLFKEGEFVDIEFPNLLQFPDFKKASPTYVDTLMPGEIVFFPHGWLHHVYTISDSISITWNFVHTLTWKSFFNYITSNKIPMEDLQVINFFSQNRI